MGNSSRSFHRGPFRAAADNFIWFCHLCSSVILTSASINDVPAFLQFKTFKKLARLSEKTFISGGLPQLAHFIQLIWSIARWETTTRQAVVYLNISNLSNASEIFENGDSCDSPLLAVSSSSRLPSRLECQKKEGGNSWDYVELSQTVQVIAEVKAGPLNDRSRHSVEDQCWMLSWTLSAPLENWWVCVALCQMFICTWGRARAVQYQFRLSFWIETDTFLRTTYKTEIKHPCKPA